jgi:hypothetical protein
MRVEEWQEGERGHRQDARAAGAHKASGPDSVMQRVTNGYARNDMTWRRGGSMAPRKNRRRSI